MVRVIIVLVSATIVLLSCQSKETEKPSVVKPTADSAYEYAVDVPVNQPEVVITIDSLSFFQSDKLKKDESTNTKKLISNLKNLDSKFDAYTIVKNNTVKILNDNKYTYTIADNFSAKDFPKEIISQENIHQLIDFNKLKSNYKSDDIILINVKNGFDYNELDLNKYVAKTYVYIYILNLKDQVLKFSESIAGTKYIEEPIENINTDNLAAIMKNSIENTMQIIDKKY